MSSERVVSSKGGSIISSSMPTNNNSNNNNNNNNSKGSEPEALPCPRCDSTNTKFCYYNNYNLSQPRHFCKSCRRYWTRGGTFRNVPIGGGTRRSSSSNKRPRTDSSATSSLSTNSTHQEVLNSLPVQEMGHGLGGLGGYIGGYEMNLNNEALPENSGSFSSLLNGEMHGNGGLFWGGHQNNRFVGVGSAGFYGMGFGVNVLDFPMEPVRDGGGAAVVSGGGGGGGNTWQHISGVEAGINDVGGNNNDNFSWPDLAISTPAGKSLK